MKADRFHLPTRRRWVPGFTLIEVLVTVAIIGAIATIVGVALFSARTKARDTKRRFEITQLGRFITQSCYLPNAGGGEYDLVDLLAELRTKYPQYASAMSQTPKDPKTGTATQSFYKYAVTVDGKQCVLFANLEHDNEPVTLVGLTAPTAGGGTGVLATSADGWNGSNRYYQISN